MPCKFGPSQRIAVVIGVVIYMGQDHYKLFITVKHVSKAAKGIRTVRIRHVTM